jgi:phosphoribosylglycinamide formyltransferase-1
MAGWFDIVQADSKRSKTKMKSKIPEIAVLVSGKGSLLRAIYTDGEASGCYHVKRVICDRICPAIDVTRDLKIPNILIRRPKKHLSNLDRELFTQKLEDELRFLQVQLIVMAGFMTILSPCIFKTFRDRILNIHPSLLPDFKGAHAVRDFLASGKEITGCTVHIATEDVNQGTILAQRQVCRVDGDTEATLHARIKCAESECYPSAVAKFLKDSS